MGKIIPTRKIITALGLLTILFSCPFNDELFSTRDHRRVRIKQLIKRVRSGDRTVLRLVTFDTFLAIHRKMNGSEPNKPSFKNKIRVFGWKSLCAYLGGLSSQDPRIRYRCMKQIIKFVDPVKAKSLHGQKIQNIQEFDLKGVPLRDEELITINDYSGLKALYLQSTEITNKGLKHISKLKSLETLDLSGTQVNGKGFAFLKDLNNLKELYLNYKDLEYSDELGKLIQLEALYLEGTDILKRVDKDPSDPFDCQKIINYTHESKFLKSLTKLKILSLAESWLDDKALADLSSLTSLRKLDLSYTEITDKGLKHLMGLKNLGELYILENKISKVAVQKLKKALPKCKIHHNKTRK